MGAVALLVGLGTGYLMLAHPEGLNPSWPLGAALLAPAAFTLVGVLMVSSGLGFPRVTAFAARGVLLCLIAVANWAAFFDEHVHCIESVSFFGVPILSRQPTEADCRARLRGIVLAIDAFAVLLIAGSVWWKLRGSGQSERKSA